MKKRQRKKENKKYVMIPCDEFNLMTMTAGERETAWKEYQRFVKKYCYCKTYKELKARKAARSHKMPFYAFPVGSKLNDSIQCIATMARRTKVKSVLAIQTMDDFKKAE